jgi:hypothetical protein
MLEEEVVWEVGEHSYHIFDLLVTCSQAPRYLCWRSHRPDRVTTTQLKYRLGPGSLISILSPTSPQTVDDPKAL